MPEDPSPENIKQVLGSFILDRMLSSKSVLPDHIDKVNDGIII